MSEIDVAAVKALRDKTGAGVMDCKNALAQSNGDLGAAVEWLRRRGISRAANKEGRVAAEGLVAVTIAEHRGAIVELNAETDFVARNAQFRDAAAMFAKIALKVDGDLQRLLAAPLPGGEGSVWDHIARLRATLGENIVLRRCAALTADGGIVMSYTHNAIAPGLGGIGALVALESAAPEAAGEIGRKLAMHVAAAAPRWISPGDIPAYVVQEKRDALAAEAARTGKPAETAAKMVEGRLRKFRSESVLTEQAFVLDPERTVEAALEDAARAAGTAIAVRGFVRFKTGEGLDRDG